MKNGYERDRDLNDEEEKEPRWLRFSKHPLVQVFFGFVLTWAVGTVLTGHWKDKQLQNERALEADRARTAANLQSVQDLSELMYERRTRAELLASAIRRNWPLEDVRARKAAYDSAYVRWNRGIMRTQLLIRSIVDEKDYSSIEAYVQQGLVPHLTRLDSALTAAFTQRYANPGTPADLDAKLVRAEMDTVTSCAYEITNALWIAVASRGSADTSWVRIDNTSAHHLSAYCPQRPNSSL